MKESEVLSQEEIARVRKLRKASIRRRRIIVFTLLIVLIALLVCAGLFHFSYWWAAIPAILLVTVLALGAHASAVARAWERKVAMQSFPAASESEDNVASAEVNASADHSASDHSGDAVQKSDGAPTHVIPLPEVREILAQQARDKEAQDEEQAKQAEHQNNSAKVDQAKTDKVKAEAAQSEMVKSAQSSSDQSKPDLISFSLGTSDSMPHVAKSADDKNSDKNSDQKVAKESDNKSGQKSSAATTPSATSSHKAVKPSAEVRRQIFADVTPSVTTIHRVSAPRKSADSLGVDLNAVLARRQK